MWYTLFRNCFVVSERKNNYNLLGMLQSLHVYSYKKMKKRRRSEKNKKQKNYTFLATHLLYRFCCYAVEYTRICSAVIFLNVLCVT